MSAETHGHTHRLDLLDATVREWDATVLAVDPEQGIVLDRSAFYPGGGGQPPDEGVLLWGGVRTRIAGTRKGDELYLIPVEGDPVPPPGTAVRGALDDERRTALMRTHSGLHVLHRRRVPGLRGAGDRRQHGAADRADGLRPGRGAGRLQGPGRRGGQRRDRRGPADRGEDAAGRARRSRSPTSSGRRPTCCRPTSRRCGSSTSSGWTPRPTAARTSRRRRWSAGWRS